MYKFILLIVFVCAAGKHYAQSDTLKAKLFRAVELHDQGNYQAAILLYDEVIAADPDNLLAWYEKSFSLFAAKQFRECADLCRDILKKFSEGNELDNVYVNYGSSLDALGRPEEALKVYSEGIKKYNHYLLFFNRGVTLYQQKRNAAAAADFQEALRLNPLHASSHQYLGYSIIPQNKIAGIMSLSVFLMIEPVSERAKKNLQLLNEQYNGFLKKGEGKSFTISLNSAMLDDNKKEPDDFSITELAMALRISLDEDSIMQHQQEADKMQGRLNLLAEASDEGPQEKGFFSSFYVPFFKSLKDNNKTLAASHLLLAGSSSGDNRNWLKENPEKIDQFRQWLREYKWLGKESDK